MNPRRPNSTMLIGGYFLLVFALACILAVAFPSGSLAQKSSLSHVPVAPRLRARRFSRLNPKHPSTILAAADGSCMIVIATDAPLDARQLKRTSMRALPGMARTGSTFSHGSGDYVISFRTAEELQYATGKSSISARATISDDDLTTFFEAAADATEEAIYNSLAAELRDA